MKGCISCDRASSSAKKNEMMDQGQNNKVTSERVRDQPTRGEREDSKTKQEHTFLEIPKGKKRGRMRKKRREKER